MSDFSEWGISYRAWHALELEDIHTVDDLLQIGQEGLLRLVNVGKVTVAELVAEAQSRGIVLPYKGKGETVAYRLAKLEARVAKLEGSR
jgi:DNA-directed RNA polymerase alpha subunit